MKPACFHVYILTNTYNPEVISAIAREKEIKGWTRQKKIKLIESVNPDWKDLFYSGDPSLRGLRSG